MEKKINYQSTSIEVVKKTNLIFSQKGSQIFGLSTKINLCQNQIKYNLVSSLGANNLQSGTIHPFQKYHFSTLLGKQKTKYLVPVSVPNQRFGITNMESGKNFDFFLFSNKFINLLMVDGKKLKASTIFFEMLSHLKKEIEGKKEVFSKGGYDLSILQMVFQALENVKPSLEVRKVRVAGSTYLVPCVLSKKRQETLALRWIIESARKKKKNSKFSLSECLADELLNASKKQGQARQKRDELHRLAEANRAYIRYRWW